MKAFLESIFFLSEDVKPFMFASWFVLRESPLACHESCSFFVLITEGVNPEFTLQALALALACWQWQSFLCCWGYEWNWVRSGAQWLQFFKGASPDDRSCAMSVLKRIFLKNFCRIGKRGKNEGISQKQECGDFEWWLFLAEVKTREEVLNRIFPLVGLFCCLYSIY